MRCEWVEETALTIWEKNNAEDRKPASLNETKQIKDSPASTTFAL